MTGTPEFTPTREDNDLERRLRRWDNARERRNTPGGHGSTGTALLRQAADEIARLRAATPPVDALYDEDDYAYDREMPDDLPDEDFHIPPQRVSP